MERSDIGDACSPAPTTRVRRPWHAKNSPPGMRCCFGSDSEEPPEATLRSFQAPNMAVTVLPVEEHLGEAAMISKLLRGIAVILFASSSIGQASEIRRVVTGLSADNKAIVLFDSRENLIVGK